MKSSIRTLIFLLCLPAFSAFAAPSLNNVGIGLYSDLRQDYFYGAINTDFSSVDPKALIRYTGAKQLEIRVLVKSLSKRKFYKLFSEMIAISNSDKVFENNALDIAQFTGMLKGKLFKGDQILIDNFLYANHQKD